MSHSTPLACRGTRELVSLELDGELSQHEQARLDAHLPLCADCRDFRDRVTATTNALRATPLEQPDYRITLPPRRRARVSAAQVSTVAAVAAVLAVVGTFAMPLHLRGQRPSTLRLTVGFNNNEARVLRTIRREVLVPERPVDRAGGVQSF